jgi:type IV pilus assembly protein PilX
MRSIPLSGRRPLPRRQEGVVLMVALIVLIAMTLAGIGIMRSIDTGTLVSGNIGFRQAAVSSADVSLEPIHQWITIHRTELDTDNPALGYYSTRQDSVDITGNRTEGGLDGVDWGGSDPTQPVKAALYSPTLPSPGPPGATLPNGYTVYYLINRLCTLPGSVNLPNQSCSTAQLAAEGSTHDAPDYSSYPLRSKNSVYYRVTARVSGPKNTVSYVQSVFILK